MAFTRGKFITVIVGLPVRFCGKLYDCAAVIRNGGLKGLVPKICLPARGESRFAPGSDFLSQRNVARGHFVNDGKRFCREGFDSEISFAGQRCNISPNQLFTIGNATFGIEICEDFHATVPPSSFLALSGAQVIVNLSASSEAIAKHAERKTLISNQSRRTVSGYIYCSAGYGESTQDAVYAGSSIICENGCLLAENERFSIEDSIIFADLDIQALGMLRQKKNSFRGMTPDGTSASEYSAYYSHYDLGPAATTDFEKSLHRIVKPHPFLPEGNPKEVADESGEVLSIQTIGLMTRLEHIGCKTAVIGISGGLDSTLALLVATMAFDRLGLPRKGIYGITMPGLGTTRRTKSNATDLMKTLGITIKEISVVPAINQHFKDIGHDPDVMDSTYENAQARERTQILMDIANQEGGMVIGTGDLSELALGWCTYNGDHMSMYAVNSSVPKTLIKHLVRWAAENVFNQKAEKGQRSTKEILLDVIDTPISPELKPADSSGNINQKTEDLIGPYELHDFFLYNFYSYGWDPKKIYFFAKRAFNGAYSDAEILKWLKKFFQRFFSQQFKRSCMPDGPRISAVSLSPRAEWRMPSDAEARLWLDELDKLS